VPTGYQRVHDQKLDTLPVVADIDGDGKPEILLADGWHQNYGTNARGLLTKATFAHGAIQRVDFQIANIESGRLLALSAAYKRLCPRQQFTQIKGLGEVIVSAGIQQAYNRFLLVYRRDNQYRRGSTSASYS